MLATNEGVFLSESGAPFVPSNNGFSHRTVANLQIDCENPTRLYAGVLSPGLSSGIYMSEDSGGSWRELGEGLRGVDVFSILQLSHAPDVIYAGTNQGLYKSGNRGQHWRRVVSGLPVGERAGKAGTVRLAEKNAGRRQSKRRISRPDPPNPMSKILALAASHRQGETWLLTERTLFSVGLDDGLWREMYQSQTGEHLLCVVTSKTVPGTLYLGSTNGLRISPDGGITWESFAVDGQQYQVQAVAEDTIDSRTIYVGTPFGLFRLLKREDGVNWSRCGNGLPQVSVAAIEINPRNGAELIVGDLRHGGLYRSVDRGEHWKRIDSGFASARVYALAFDRQASPSLYAGTLNGGTYIGKRRKESLATSGVGEEIARRKTERFLGLIT